ncbi:MAG TPA: VCBS repeat-containing protein, partial [Candidatus Acidoferrales bacterium]
MASSSSAHSPVGPAANNRLGANAFSLSSTSLPGFDFRPSLPAGFLPTGVATGDLNGDGNVDWVVSNGGSNDVWVYLERGDGTAALPTIVPLAGQSPTAVALTDLRGIGILDLVVTEADSSTVEVLLGNGDGTFGQGTLYSTPDPPSAVAVADFNGDGHLDVVVGMVDEGINNPSVDTDAIAFLPGDGSGRFGSAVAWSNGNAVPNITGLAVSDLNGDGRPDLVFLEGYGGAPGVYALLGQGDGTFQQAYYDNHTPGSVNWDAIAVGDLNEDGHPDLVIIDTFGDASVAFGNGDGTFAPESARKIFGVGDTAFSASLVDLNGDGHLDLVAGSAGVLSDMTEGLNAGDLVCVLFGDGAGNLSTATVYRGDPSMYSLAVA